MIPDENMDIYTEIKRSGKVKYVSKYLNNFFTLFLMSSKTK